MRSHTIETALLDILIAQIKIESEPNWHSKKWSIILDMCQEQQDIIRAECNACRRHPCDEHESLAAELWDLSSVHSHLATEPVETLTLHALRGDQLAASVLQWRTQNDAHNLTQSDI